MALTKSQIKAKINSLTKENNNYMSERTKYKNSLSYANKLISSLKSSNNYLNSSNNNLKKYFMINGKTADDGKIVNIKEDVNKIIKKLNNTIIPNINSNIKNLDNKINSTTKEINVLKRQYETAEM